MLLTFIAVWVCAWPLKGSFVFFGLSSILEFPVLFPVNKFPHLVK